MRNKESKRFFVSLLNGGLWMMNDGYRTTSMMFMPWIIKSYLRNFLEGQLHNRVPYSETTSMEVLVSQGSKEFTMHITSKGRVAHPM
jgi:hypothetical protein